MRLPQFSDIKHSQALFQILGVHLYGASILQVHVRHTNICLVQAIREWLPASSKNTKK